MRIIVISVGPLFPWVGGGGLCGSSPLERRLGAKNGESGTEVSFSVPPLKATNVGKIGKTDSCLGCRSFGPVIHRVRWMVHQVKALVSDAWARKKKKKREKNTKEIFRIALPNLFLATWVLTLTLLLPFGVEYGCLSTPLYIV